MDILLWLNTNIGTSPSEAFVTCICISVFYIIVNMILVDEISYLADKFSPAFRRTLSWVFIFCFLSIISQGAIADMKEEFARNIYGGSGYLIGTFIALVIFPILLTYFIRLFFPLFKWIHNKTQ